MAEESRAVVATVSTMPALLAFDRQRTPHVSLYASVRDRLCAELADRPYHRVSADIAQCSRPPPVRRCIRRARRRSPFWRHHRPLEIVDRATDTAGANSA